MERIVERPGALDVHRASVTACVRVWEEGELIEHLAEFQTTIQGLLALRDWLESLAVRRVAMEATGVYWRPVWAVLEDRFELMLVNARHVKQVPGRKTDVKDAQWLCQLLEAGLLRASLVPPKPIRTLRNLTRYRKTQINDRQREAARLHKIFEDTGIKLGCIASDIMGKGSKWLRATLTEAALAATKTKNSYLAAQYQRLRGRRGHSKAVTAVGHSILTAAWHMLHTSELYRDLGGDYITRQNPDLLTKRLVRQLQALGHQVTLEPLDAAA